MFAYKLVDAKTGLDFTPDPTYFDAQVVSYKNVWNVALNTYDVASTKVAVEPCKPSLLNPLNYQGYDITQSLIDRTRFTSYMCPSSLDLNFVGGRYYDNLYNFTAIQLNACNNATRNDCKTYD